MHAAGPQQPLHAQLHCTASKAWWCHTACRRLRLTSKHEGLRMDISNACCFLRSGRMSWYRLATTALLPTCTATEMDKSADRFSCWHCRFEATDT